MKLFLLGALNTVVRKYRRSQYTKPLVVFVIFLLLCAILTVLFESRGNANQFGTLLDGFWWAIITFSTTGYGDKVPITLGGRIVAIVTILIGIAGMSLLSGGLASWLIDRNTRARRGLVNYNKMKNHFIICGWKHDMLEILTDIENNSHQIMDNIVIVSNIDVDTFEQVKEHDSLRGIRLVHGDYFSVNVLQRAGIRSAKKVLVLADNIDGATPTEIDSRTVLTVLTIKSIARDVYVIAELLDKNFQSYLQYVNCDEILFSRDVARKMLANASVIDGMSHILYSLISRDSTSANRLETVKIPEEYIGTEYGEYRAVIESDKGSRKLVLGLLENTGNPARLKIDLLRQAQKTSDVSELVANLKTVKGVELNKPVIFPTDDHTIRHNTQAVVLVSERVNAPKETQVS